MDVDEIPYKDQHRSQRRNKQVRDSMEKSWLLFLICLLFHLFFFTATVAAFPIAKPGCYDKCGDVSIPYPFGIKSKDCYREGFELLCNDTHFNPPKLFVNATIVAQNFVPIYGIEVTNITLNSTATVLYTYNKQCNAGVYRSDIRVGVESPFTFSYTHNKLTAIGCDTYALFRFREGDFDKNFSFCSSSCDYQQNNFCSGFGCCQANIPPGVKRISMELHSPGGHKTTSQFGNCSYSFVIEEDQYNFNFSDIKNFKLTEVPIMLDWAIGNKTCQEVNSTTVTSDFACGANSDCFNSTNGAGYRCFCRHGFEGNPYLPNGCVHNNTDLVFNKDLTIPLVVGIGLGTLFLLAIGFIFSLAAIKRKKMRLKEKYFKLNGGELLNQKMMHEGNEGIVYTTRIFEEDELKIATRNFSEERVLGRGGNGTVYKGILTDNTTVAIKKSKMLEDEREFHKEQFINEVIILSQVIHKNVVKIIGCCLETQVPLLVYEYVPNKTLSYHIHEDTTSTLSWSTRLRIAIDTANAVAYLHSSLSTPVIHRDIKSANILLDDSFMTKVSDFGASRLVPLMDELEIITMVQGTLGYLDPEYFHTGQLTDKSDVYSFGVVLAELLTGQKPISFLRKEEDRNLASYFIKCLKEDCIVEILDPRIAKECVRKEVDKIALLTGTCLCPIREQRPNMREVVAELEKLRGHGKSARTVVDHVDVDQTEHSGRTTESVGGVAIEKMSLLYGTTEGRKAVEQSIMPSNDSCSMYLPR